MLKNRLQKAKLIKTSVVEKVLELTTSYPDESFVVITLDSLRYDVAACAKTKNLKRLFKFAESVKWVKVGSHGTYTLPSHISMFHSGAFPCDNRKHIKAPFNRIKKRLFKAQLAWNRTEKAIFPTPPAENIVKGFEKLGYRTIGIGGVYWFSPDFESSKVWSKYYFKEFYWDAKFTPDNFKSLEYQIELLKKLKLDKESKPIFLFINISVTHEPYLGFGKSKEGQAKALGQFDKKLPEIIKYLPKEFHLLILSDHGDCFGEDGLWGHGFYHPKVMEVPFNYIHVTANVKNSLSH